MSNEAHPTVQSLFDFIVGDFQLRDQPFRTSWEMYSMTCTQEEELIDACLSALHAEDFEMNGWMKSLPYLHVSVADCSKSREQLDMVHKFFAAANTSCVECYLRETDFDLEFEAVN